jgi:hypothetical protein
MRQGLPVYFSVGHFNKRLLKQVEKSKEKEKKK